MSGREVVMLVTMQLAKCLSSFLNKRVSEKNPHSLINGDDYDYSCASKKNKGSFTMKDKAEVV